MRLCLQWQQWHSGANAACLRFAWTIHLILWLMPLVPPHKNLVLQLQTLPSIHSGHLKRKLGPKGEFIMWTDSRCSCSAHWAFANHLRINRRVPSSGHMFAFFFFFFFFFLVN